MLTPTSIAASSSKSKKSKEDQLRVQLLLRSLESEECFADINTKVLSKEQFDAFLTLINSLLYYPYISFFLSESSELKSKSEEAKEQYQEIADALFLLSKLKNSEINNVGKKILSDLKILRDKDLKVFRYLKSWNETMLLDPELITQDPHVIVTHPQPQKPAKSYEEIREASDNLIKKIEDGTANSDDMAKVFSFSDPPPKIDKEGQKAEIKRILALPLEERDLDHLDCNQKIKILSHESKIEEFSKKFAKFRCSNINISTKTCMDEFIYKKELSPEEKDKVRINLFKWSWLVNHGCNIPLENASTPKTEKLESYSWQLEQYLDKYLINKSCVGLDY